MGLIVPFTSIWRKRRKMFRSRYGLQEKIREALAQDPEIRNRTKISAAVERGGWFGKDTIRLIGETDDPHDRERAGQVAENTAQNIAVVRNEIVVKR